MNTFRFPVWLISKGRYDKRVKVWIGKISKSRGVVRERILSIPD